MSQFNTFDDFLENFEGFGQRRTQGTQTSNLPRTGVAGSPFSFPGLARNAGISGRGQRSTGRGTPGSISRFSGRPGFPIGRPGARIPSAVGGGPSTFDRLGGALSRDIQEQDEAARRQFERNQAEQQQLRDFIGGIGGRISGAAGESLDLLRGLSGEFAEQGREGLESFERGAAGVLERVDDDVSNIMAGIDRRVDRATNAALKFAQDAVTSARGAVSGFDQDFHELMTAQVSGLEARAQDQRKMIEAGLRPDGTMMTPAEQQEARRQLQFDTRQAVAQTTAQIGARSNEFIAQLRTNVASVQTAAGQIALGTGELGLRGEQLKLGAAEFRAQAGVAISGQRVEAQRVAQGFGELRANLANVMTSVMNSAAATAVQLEMEGRFELAKMVRDNPESVVSWFSGLAAMFALETARDSSRAASRQASASQRLADLREQQG